MNHTQFTTLYRRLLYLWDRLLCWLGLADDWQWPTGGML